MRQSQLLVGRKYTFIVLNWSTHADVRISSLRSIGVTTIRKQLRLEAINGSPTGPPIFARNVHTGMASRGRSPVRPLIVMIGVL